MSIEQLERDMADRFKVQRDALQKTNDRLDKLQTLTETLVATQSLAAENFIAALDCKKPERIDAPAKQISDVDFLKQRIEKLELNEDGMTDEIERLEKSKLDLEATIENWKERHKEAMQEVYKLQESNERLGDEVLELKRSHV